MSNVFVITPPHGSSCVGCQAPLPPEHAKRAWCDDCKPAGYQVRDSLPPVNTAGAMRARSCRCPRPLTFRSVDGDVQCGRCGREVQLARAA